MMKNKQYIYGLFTSLLLASCSVEAPFEEEKPSGKGELSKYALNFDLSLLNNNASTRAGNDDIINDFDIKIVKSGSSTPVLETKYGQLPEVVSLNAGTYKVLASYGEDVIAEFESPYYLGESGEFNIEANKITTNIGTIICKLENVKVTIDFHSSLHEATDDDAYVEVKVNNQKGLQFKKGETKAGYFQHQEVCTLTATFHGKVDGVLLNEVKTLNSIQKGNHYKLTFTKHVYSDDQETGDVNGSLNVSASVTIVNLNENITIAEDEILKDDERPSEQDPSTGQDPDPNDPENPEPNDPEEPGELTRPSITAEEGINLDQVNDLIEGMPIVLYIKSNSKISSFKVKISSNDSGFMQAINEMIGEEFDLITLNKDDEEDLGFALSGLGFPVGDEVSDPAEVDENGYGIVKFEVTAYLQMLLKAYEGIHEFNLNVTNEIGTTEATLRIKVTK